jgi:hypothetical protein
MDWENEIARVREDFPQVAVVELPGGMRWVELDDLEIPPGWSPARSRIAVEVPADFPEGKPNGFFVEPGLAAPAGFPQPPPTGEGRHGKSWAPVCYQPQIWVPERETLWRYIKAMMRWFAEAK